MYIISVLCCLPNEVHDLQQHQFIDIPRGGEHILLMINGHQRGYIVINVVHTSRPVTGTPSKIEPAITIRVDPLPIKSL